MQDGMSGAGLTLRAAHPVLEVRDYSLAYHTHGSGSFDALTSINLAIKRGRTLGLVGESGSGKSSLAWAIMRYLPINARELGGSLLLSGEDLRAKTRAEIAELRGGRISMVFQDPSTSLNPTLTLGYQLAEVLVRHRRLARKDALAESEALLHRVGITRPAAMMRRYPHQASGGEKQRVVIATAFACSPECIIFDEPTTALDVITARQILDLFAALQQETQVAALYISHDLGLVSRIADEVAVIHRGRIIEEGSTHSIFASPRRDYTKALLAAVPDVSRRLTTSEPDTQMPPLLQARHLTVRYASGGGGLASLLGRKRETVIAARSVDLDLRRGEVLGLVGESGSGKSTIAKALVGLQDFSGEIQLDDGRFGARRDFDRAYRREVQIVFQHPDASLNPRQRIGEILSRPLKLYRLARGAAIRSKVHELLALVSLPAEFALRYPHQLSGGEKQRVAIARAFAAEPRVVICDEITSSLDVSVQASIARLLVALQARSGTACLFISHDLNLVRQLAHRIAVIFRGDIVDLFDAASFAAQGRHPYTSSLAAAVTTLAAAQPV
jgi:peptide/nickel transport system ATP-binding protein